MAKIYFSKIKLVKARKKIFQIFFELLKEKITCKLNMYRLIANVSKKFYKKVLK